MTYYEAEGQHNPHDEPELCLPECGKDTKGGWSGLVSDAHSAIRVTLEELALLASIVTAETVTHSLSHVPPLSGRSAYSLLLEPALFKFPA